MVKYTLATNFVGDDSGPFHLGFREASFVVSYISSHSFDDVKELSSMSS